MSVFSLLFTVAMTTLLKICKFLEMLTNSFRKNMKIQVEILVFDEATSALDNDTESAIMDAINSFHGRKTLIIIAHRLRTIENCDIIYNVDKGKIESNVSIRPAHLLRRP